MALFDLAGRRWMLRVLWELARADAPPTFRELRAHCSDMSSSVLTRRVAELRTAKLVQDDSYALTDLGHGLVETLQPLLTWSRTWAAALD